MNHHSARQGEAWFGWARQGKDFKTPFGMASRGRAWRGQARLGEGWRGKARIFKD